MLSNRRALYRQRSAATDERSADSAQPRQMSTPQPAFESRMSTPQISADVSDDHVQTTMQAIGEQSASDARPMHCGHCAGLLIGRLFASPSATVSLLPLGVSRLLHSRCLLSLRSFAASLVVCALHSLPRLRAFSSRCCAFPSSHVRTVQLVLVVRSKSSTRICATMKSTRLSSRAKRKM